jgi:uncharacterized protein
VKAFADKIYGTITIDDPCALDILASPAFDRLWHVNQYGPYRLVRPELNTTRGEHCIGVYHLLRIHGASREEQIAGLVHDANHLTLSHVMDFLLGDSATQESHVGMFEVNPHIETLKSIVRAHDLDAERIFNPQNWSLLEQPTPMACADRLDYGLRDGLCYGQTSSQEVANLLESLRVADGKFAMNDADAAERLARISLDTQTVREGYWGMNFFHTLSRALKRALQLGAIVKDDFLGTDEDVFRKLLSTDDFELQLFKSWLDAGAPVGDCLMDGHTHSLVNKVRWMDPLVVTESSLMPISHLRPGLKRLIEENGMMKRDTKFFSYPKEFKALVDL